MDNDGYISNGELFQVLKMMVGNNLKDTQLQQIVDKTICFADKDEDGKISFEEFCSVSIPFLTQSYSGFSSLIMSCCIVWSNILILSSHDMLTGGGKYWYT